MIQIVLAILPGVSRLFAALVPILLLFFYTKTADLEQIGLVGYFVSLITIVGVLTDFGLPEAAQKFIPQSTDKRNIIGKILFTEIFAIVLGLALLIGVDVVTNGELSKGYFTVLVVTLFFSISNVILVIFNGLNEKNRVSIYFFSAALTFFSISTISFLFFDFNAVDSFFLGRLISWIIFTFVPLIDLFRMGYLNLNPNIEGRMIKFSLNIFVAAFAYVLFTQWDSIIVTQLGSVEQNGVYKPVEFLASLPLALRVILETKILPEYSTLFATNQIELLKKKFKFMTIALAGLGVVTTIVAISLTNFGLKLFYNEEIAEEGGLIFILTLAGTFLYIISVPSISVLQAVGEEGKVRNAALIQAFIFLTLATLLFTPLGVNFLPLLLLVTCGLFLIYTLGSTLYFFSKIR